jgi:hypothetical protein
MRSADVSAELIGFQCKWNSNGGKISDLPNRYFPVRIKSKVCLEDNEIKQQTERNIK